jgi:hypothetical protein
MNKFEPFIFNNCTYKSSVGSWHYSVGTVTRIHGEKPRNLYLALGIHKTVFFIISSRVSLREHILLSIVTGDFKPKDKGAEA